MNQDILNEIELNPIYTQSEDDQEQKEKDINFLNLFNYNRFAEFKQQPVENHFIQRQLINKNQSTNDLKSVNLIPPQFRNVFESFPYFNHVQSLVFDDAIHTDKNLVISAPTSSGKTVLLEIAIIRLLVTANYTRVNSNRFKFKIIYMAPLKALCTEKYNEWYGKFDKLHGLKCIELTGDSDADKENEIENANIICTTPEKWDSMTRKLKNRQLIMSRVKLMLIDEIHVLGESSRGATIEAVISRMKLFSSIDNSPIIRFLAISATIPNIDDIATWLSVDYSTPATVYKLGDTFRPVKLNKIVVGYKCDKRMKDFNFDLSLNYKISYIIDEYSNGKPTLIFCSTRKVSVQAAQILAKTKNYFNSQQHKLVLRQTSQNVKDPVLRDFIFTHGIGYHHAGLDSSDRNLVENLFLNGHLLVLFSTSTLAIGVNLPAHLVIIKSTMYYSNQSMIEYSTSQILQMIGRAGRPQFDTSATAVIMTKSQDKKKYESLVEGQQLIESQLHSNLIEHLNVEIVMGTIINISSAINWLKSTFFYARIKKNPQYYGVGLDKNSLSTLNNENRIEKCLKDLCIQSLNDLMKVNLIEKCDFIMNPDTKLKPTLSGHLMARYCTAFDTMSSITTCIRNSNCQEDNKNAFLSLESLIDLISQSKELEEIKLRTSEKSLLNSFNNNGKTSKKNAENLIRYIQPGKVKTSQMKINILIQAQLGSLQINDFSLTQDLFKIFRIGQRIIRCLFEYQLQVNNQELTGSTNQFKNYLSFLNSVILYKNFVTKLWFDSPHLFKQFNRIGPTLSAQLVKAEICSFEDILKHKPRMLEHILNKNPPFGDRILETIKKLPKFKIEFKQEILTPGDSVVDVVCKMENYEYILSLGDGGCLGLSNQIMFIVGDENYNLLFATRWNNSSFLKSNGSIVKKINLNNKINGCVIHVSLVLLQFVGLDLHESFNTFETLLDYGEGRKENTNKEKSIKFQNGNVIYVDDAEDDNSVCSNDEIKFDITNSNKQSPVNNKKRKFYRFNNLDTTPEPLAKKPICNKENLELKKFDFSSKRKPFGSSNQINKIDSYFKSKKNDNFKQIVVYRPLKEESSIDYLSELFKNELENSNEMIMNQNSSLQIKPVQIIMNEFNNKTLTDKNSNKDNVDSTKKFNFNSKSKIQITKISKATMNLAETNYKIEMYFKPNLIAYSPIKRIEYFSNQIKSGNININSKSNETYKKRHIDDVLDVPDKHRKRIFRDAYGLSNFNI